MPEIPARTVAIVQARVGSTRLPGKVLKEICGKPMLLRVIDRLRVAKSLDEVAVATSTQKGDDLVEALCDRSGIACFRGSEDDVLDRYYQCASARHATVVVRITADCPLIDPALVDLVVVARASTGADYAGNTRQLTYPRGLDTEVFTFEALERAWQQAAEPYQREHVTPYFYQHPEEFRIHSVTSPEDCHEHRWTVDTDEDFELVCRIYSELGDRVFSWREALDLVRRQPQLATINSMIRQKTLNV